MRRHRAAIATLMMLAFPATLARAAPDGAALFARCAACHLPTGEGVPGSFPALRGQIVRFARLPAGRTYMITVVTHGLVGALTANGVAYDGFMPAQALADDEAAAVLTYVADSLADAQPEAAPFTAGEVASVRAHNAAATAQISRALRPDALAAK